MDGMIEHIVTFVTDDISLDLCDEFLFVKKKEDASSYVSLLDE